MTSQLIINDIPAQTLLEKGDSSLNDPVNVIMQIEARGI